MVLRRERRATGERPARCGDGAVYGAAPGTTRDGGTPGTTRDGTAAGNFGVPEQKIRFVRVNLPPALAQQYTVVRELGSGGEADLVLVTDNATGEQRVVRLYRRQDLPFDEAKLQRLRSADRNHLIGLLDYGRGDGYTWEILEFASEGSLEELMHTRPTPWGPADVLRVFDQLAPAIAYANSLGMVHRDIKPGNVLIRSLQPLDLVLADFGLTKFLTATRNMGTSSRTSAYAPPEAVTGEASRSVDWWSMGMVMVELLTGRHPFQRPDRTWQDDAMIVRELIAHEIDLSSVTDQRWKLLCRGLLTRAPEKRWGAEQVQQWRAGGSPLVAEPEPATPRRGGAPYVFGGVGYDEPVALANALRGDWNEGRRLMAGRKVNAPPYLALRDWLSRHDLNEAVRVLNDGVAERPERGLMQVILALDPDAAPEFNGRRLDLEPLHAMAGEAMLNQPGSNAREVLEIVYSEGLLTICADSPGCDGYAMLDDRWHRAVEWADGRLAQLPVQIQPADRQMMIAQLLITAFQGNEGAFAEAAQHCLRDQQAIRQPWYASLGDEMAPGPYEPAVHAVVMLTERWAAEATAQQAAAAERQRLAEEQRQVIAKRSQMDNVSALLGVICGIAAFIPVLGFAAGPAAVYFGVRARRTSHRTAATWAIALGALGFLSAICTIGSLFSTHTTTP